MPSHVINKAKGLHTNNSYFSEVPEGSMSVANNVVIDRPDIVESRRGIKQYAEYGSSSLDVAKQLIPYKNKILVHYSNVLAYDNSTTFVPYSSTFTEALSGLRTKYVEQNGNLFLTSSEGIKKLSVGIDSDLSTGVISNAGGIKAISGEASPNFDKIGFLEKWSKVAYRIVWGTKDINNNLILGTPSMPFEIVNQSSTPCDVNVTFGVPNNITTSYFYRVYRTATFTSDTFLGIVDLTVNDEFYLVYEDSYVSGTSITIVDIVDENYRAKGAPLYTNANSGEGILQSNEPPPFAHDIEIYKNYTFYANTRTKHRLSIDLVGLDGIRRMGAYGDSIGITSVTFESGLLPLKRVHVVTTQPHGLTPSDTVYFTNSGSSLLDGQRLVTGAGVNDFYVEVDEIISSGLSTANLAIFTASLKITRDTTSYTYWIVGKPEVNTLNFATGHSAGINGDYFILYSADDKIKYVVYFIDGTDTPPNNSETEGATFISVNTSSSDTATNLATKVATAINNASYDFNITQVGSTLTISTLNSGASSNPIVATLSPVSGLTTTNIQNGISESIANRWIRYSSLQSPSQRIDDTARSIANVVSRTTGSFVNCYYMSDPTDIPGKLLFEATDLSQTFFKLETNNREAGQMFSPTLGVIGLVNPVKSSNEVKKNRIMYSKYSQPEAVPIVNYIDIGPQDKAILRIVALRDSLFILKEEGIYRLSGEIASNFSVTMFDSSAFLLAPDTCAIMNNQIYALTSQGASRISETGVEVISQPVGDKIKLYSSPSYVNFKTASFGCAHTEDMTYYLFMPKKASDNTGSICLRFNAETMTWTTMTKQGNAKCAVVEPNSNLLYVGPDDDNIIEVERKTLTRDDYADRQYTVNLGDAAVDGLTLSLDSVVGIEPGDVLMQEQYITAAIINRLSKKFALDTGVPNTVGNSNKDFYRNFKVVAGDNFQNKLGSLITQLNTDLGTSFNTVYSSDILTFKNQYDALIELLNDDDTLTHSNYLESTISSKLEMTINKVDTINNTVSVSLIMPIQSGSLTHFKAIEAEYVLNPVYFGDASVTKQVREATIMFLSAGITTGRFEFCTDLSGHYEGVDYMMEGTGNWGSWLFGNVSWGGEGSSRPFRTLIPLNKQRCRFIQPRFYHKAAFDDFKVLGISLVFRIIGPRGYK